LYIGPDNTRASGSGSQKGTERSCDDEGSQKTDSSYSKIDGTNSSRTTTTSGSVETNKSLGGGSSICVGGPGQSQTGTSTSLGSSSAITIESKKSSGDDGKSFTIV
jgi:hypothetical protein